MGITPRWSFTVKYNEKIFNVACNHPDEIAGIIDPINPPDFTIISSCEYQLPKPNKYFLCFGFENFSPKDLEKFHVTMIYLGAENGWNIEQVKQEVDLYFGSLGFETTPFHITFSEPDMFGRNKDIRVLLPKLYSQNLFLCDLRSMVQRFQSHNDFPFNPHLSTDLHYFSGRITKLFLCGKGYEVFYEWSL